MQWTRQITASLRRFITLQCPLVRVDLSPMADLSMLIPTEIWFLLTFSQKDQSQTKISINILAFPRRWSCVFVFDEYERALSKYSNLANIYIHTCTIKKLTSRWPFIGRRTNCMCISCQGNARLISPHPPPSTFRDHLEWVIHGRLGVSATPTVLFHLAERREDTKFPPRQLFVDR